MAMPHAGGRRARPRRGPRCWAGSPRDEQLGELRPRVVELLQLEHVIEAQFTVVGQPPGEPPGVRLEMFVDPFPERQRELTF